jgi:hypothetical protein
MDHRGAALARQTAPGRPVRTPTRRRDSGWCWTVEVEAALRVINRVGGERQGGDKS